MSDRAPGGLVSDQLLSLLRDSGHVCAMRTTDWERTVRLARQARLLGRLGHRLIGKEDLRAYVPARVQGHLQSAINVAAHRAQMVRMELHALDKALPAEIQVALLKGAAYLCQSMPIACGRLPGDVDLLVRRADIDVAESALLQAGWKCQVKDAYDLQYYRAWSHELPPMRFPGHALEVDLHHTIAPVTSRVRADDGLLFADLLQLPGSRYFVLHPADQIIHAAIHLFQDSDLTGRLSELVDIDGLLRHHLQGHTDWTELLARAAKHGATRPLWYALHYCRSWLDTPIPENLDPPSPPAVARKAVDWLFTRACPPRIPDQPPRLTVRIADRLGQIRYHLLRMPLRLLVPHLVRKAVRKIW